jgi:branched-chain amino acid transport system substrate-binding protein
MIAPAMPVVMQKDRTFFSLLGLAVNSEFRYPRYFSITPTGGPRPKESFAEGFFLSAAKSAGLNRTLGKSKRPAVGGGVRCIHVRSR